jgi:hypothetical protein
LAAKRVAAMARGGTTLSRLAPRRSTGVIPN